MRLGPRGCDGPDRCAACRAMLMAASGRRHWCSNPPVIAAMGILIGTERPCLLQGARPLPSAPSTRCSGIGVSPPTWKPGAPPGGSRRSGVDTILQLGRLISGLSIIYITMIMAVRAGG